MKLPTFSGRSPLTPALSPKGARERGAPFRALRVARQRNG
jgi:hypothetical protein